LAIWLYSSHLATVILVTAPRLEGGNFDIKGRGCTREKKLFKLTIL